MQKRIVRLLLILGTALFWGQISILNHSCSSDPGSEIRVFSESFENYVDTLSSAYFEGRAPTTTGGRRTKEYIEGEFRRIGLKPANGDSYRQSVPLVEITGSNFSELIIDDGRKNVLSFSYLDQMVVGTPILKDKAGLTKSELVFAGYGIVAPEYDWNDYQGLDVKGKTVVVLVNDPGYSTGDESLFTGRAMTYYGRWTYKYEEAARQGAAGVLIVHETAPASYGWTVVRNSWSGPQYQLGGKDNEPNSEVQGWLHVDAAAQLFENAGLSLLQAKEMAIQRGFKPFSLKLNASVSFDVDFIESESHNIVGYVEGSSYPDETIIYMAHWDHLGKTEGPEGTLFYHGAVDNATGVGAILSIAEKFASMKKSPPRSVVFMAVTAEESGLIGSLHYANNPLFPLKTTVGGINMDGLNVYGPTHDVSVIGFGSSQLQDYLEKHAAAQNRVLVPDKYPERGSFYRSDHFNLVRKGVPMIYANSGQDFIGRDSAYAAMVKEDMAGRYHSPNDVIHELWDWSGLHQNLWLFFEVGKELASNKDWPQWNDGSEFKAIRESAQ